MATDSCLRLFESINVFYWSIAICSAALTLVVPVAGRLRLHGKTRIAAFEGARSLSTEERGRDASGELGTDASGGNFFKKVKDMIFATGFVRICRKIGIQRFLNDFQFWTVPKRWFTHFYIVGLFWSFGLWIDWLTGSNYIFTSLEKLMTQFGVCVESGGHSIAQSSACERKKTLVLSLYVLHCLRRLLESYCITVFSKSALMHVFAYLVGVTFYVAVPWCILIGDDGAMYDSSSVQLNHNFGEVSTALGILIFCFGSFEQNQCHRILASLRAFGKKTNEIELYAIPRGRLFEYVSSPHYLMEVIIYIGIVLMLPENRSLYMTLVFVFVSLTSSAIASQNYYRANFKDYPRSRKAIVPFCV